MNAPLLYGYQRDWLTDKSRFKIGMFARQTGKTFTTTLEIADDAIEHEIKGSKTRWVILSRGERQAREAMNEGIRAHASAYGHALDLVETDYWAGAVSYRALEVAFSNGSKISALPANPDTARGFSANTFLDEFAFHQDSGAIWKALFPVISAPGLKLRITSTPNGKGNKFYELMTGQDERWSRHEVDIYKAVQDGLPRDIEELREALGDEDAWAQEFELKWLDEASAWLPYDLISAVEHEEAGEPKEYRGNACFVGRDIGRRHDLHVITVLEQVGDVLWERERIEQKRATFAEMDAEFDRIMRTYKVARACVDQTGMGEKVVEDAQSRWGASRIEGVLFTGPSKLLLANAGREAFEDRKVRIPLGQPKYRADLHKLRKVTTATGAPRFVAERDDDHADRTWALFLAIYAAGDGFADYDYQPAQERTAEDEGFRYRRSSGGVLMPGVQGGLW